MTDEEILEAVSTNSNLLDNLVSNWRDPNMRNLGARSEKWEIVSKDNPIGTCYHWSDVGDMMDAPRAIVLLLPDILEDQAMYYIDENLTWESHSGGVQGSLTE